MKKLKCGCKIMENGWYYSECKYHETQCHFYNCRKKLKKGKSYYCKKHQDYMNSIADPEGYGGSDF